MMRINRLLNAGNNNKLHYWVQGKVCKISPDVASAKGLEVFSKQSVFYLVDNLNYEGFLTIDVTWSELDNRIQYRPWEAKIKRPVKRLLKSCRWWPRVLEKRRVCMRDNTKRECKVLRTDGGGTGGILHSITMFVVTKGKVLIYKAFLISHRITIFVLQHNVDGAPPWVVQCVIHATCMRPFSSIHNFYRVSIVSLCAALITGQCFVRFFMDSKHSGERVGMRQQENRTGRVWMMFWVFFNQPWTLLHNILHSFPQWISSFD